MKKYLLLHYGFENPSPEIMAAWGQWFESLGDHMVEMGGVSEGKEITRDGVKELPWDKDCITGYNIIRAADMDEAEKIAASNPYITGIRVYELREEQGS